MTSTEMLFSPLALPCGVKVSNRLVKSAMTEGLADEFGRATEDHVRLFKKWSQCGFGVLITGNVQLTREHLERPGNVCVAGPQDEQQLARLRAWARAASSETQQCWVQLNHGGRQAVPLLCQPVGPSAVVSNAINTPMAPRALEEHEIEDVVSAFASAATVLKEVGFQGVQIHAAHGYLLSSFLNPRANHRTDKYGGSLENRARALYDVVRAVRNAVGPKFVVAVKLNSSDFQQGGFSLAESAIVAAQLDSLGVDVVELSGGNYEAPAMMGAEGLGVMGTALAPHASTIRREAYFLQFAADIKKSVKRAAVMVTGGFRTASVMEAALTSGGAELIGVGRPMCGGVEPVIRWRELAASGQDASLPQYERSLDLPFPLNLLRAFKLGKTVYVVGQQMWYYRNLVRLGRDRAPVRGNILNAIFVVQLHDARQALSLQGLPPAPIHRVSTRTGFYFLTFLFVCCSLLTGLGVSV